MKISSINKVRGFTLVELIVVITILAVLGTIAFVSFQNYVLNSRDSKRTTDIKNIEKALELSKLQTGVYPNPGGATNITFSGATAWKQGEFDNDVTRIVRNFKEAPKDPLVDSFYAYSVTKNRGEYQLGAVLEDIDYGTSPQGKLAAAYVKGNYNGKTVKVSTGSTTYILGAPSILTSDLNETDLLDIITAKKLVYKGHKNLPASYTGTIYNVDGGFDFDPSTIIAYEGDLASVDNSTLVDKLQAIFTGSIITEEPDIEVIFSENKDSTADIILGKKPGTSGSEKIENLSKESCPVIYTDQDMFTFDSGTQTIISYTGLEKDIIIPCKINDIDVLHIANNAFRSLGLTGVILPKTLISVGQDAFAQNAITQLKLNEGIKILKFGAFSQNNLTDISIPGGITTFEGGMFTRNNITTASLGEGLTVIPRDTFSQGSKIKEIILPDSLLSIGSNAFSYNEISNIKFPENLTSIGDGAFEGNKLSKVSVPNKVSYIGNYAFADNAITELKLSTTLSSLGSEAFARNNLTTVTNFDGLISSDYIYYEESAGKITIAQYIGSSTAINLPNNIGGKSITKIGNKVFSNKNLVDVSFPSNLEEIGDNAFERNALSNITLPDSLISIGSNAFAYNILNNVTLSQNLTNIGYYAFRKNNITNIVLPESLINIGSYAFMYNSLTGITIPTSVNEIGRNAFKYNSLSLGSIVIKCSMPTLGYRIFDNNIGYIPNPITCTN